VVQLAWFLFADLPQLLGCSTCPENVFLVADRPRVANAVLLVQQPIIAVLLLVGGIGVMVHRWRVATPPFRRSLAPVYLSGVVCILILALTIGVDPFFPGLGGVVSWAGGVAFTAVPLAFLFGLLRQRLGQSAVGELVVQLGATPAGPELRGALRRALRDPSLEVAYWLPDSGSYVDAAGRPFVLPPEGARVATTTVEHGGQRVAALVHDPSLRDDPDLVRAVGAAAGLALSNARLQAELRARLEELRESRSRIVAAGDAERRRLERNLHDGAQQRLLSVALGLRVAQARLAAHPEEAELLARSRQELEQSLQELRELAHGLHPAVLSDHGLAVALEAVAARSPVPVKLFVDLDGRLPDTVEAAVYYLVAEALANVAKHAQASKATVQVARQAGWALVEVRDDGIGSADPSGQGGLRGLADRIAALDGRLEVRSPQGAGTTVRAEIPCA
jgi:signal transduction histidine kinase